MRTGVGLVGYKRDLLTERRTRAHCKTLGKPLFKVWQVDREGGYQRCPSKTGIIAISGHHDCP